MDPMTLMAGASVLGGALDFFGGSSANKANARLAQAQMDFQERMSNTAYQRAVKDLQAANLNPMLAYTNGGAVSGSGASATMQNVVGSAVSSARKAAETYASVKNMQEQNKLISAQTGVAATQSDLNNASKTKAIADTAKSLADAKVSDALSRKVAAETRVISNEASKTDVTKSIYDAVKPWVDSQVNSAHDWLRNNDNRIIKVTKIPSKGGLSSWIPSVKFKTK